MSGDVELGKITTQVPARMDRLPWSRFHWLVVLGLGSVWILDGLEVTMVGSVAARLTEDGSGIALTAGQVGIAAGVYVLGACLGALFFGQLTDRFGRKKLFLITIVVYLIATAATAFAFSPLYFYIARFVTGAGIGGEYAAVNSAIDELIPARLRGRIDLIINGSYWLGAALGAASALFFLDPDIFPKDIGWRLAFGFGVVLAFVVLFVRKNIPESPRWLFIHGYEDEAERIVGDIEHGVREETAQELPEPKDSLTIRQRKTISFVEIAKVAFKLYPKRSILCFALFVGQAFIYNGITFNLGTLFNGFYGIPEETVPIFIIIWALSNFVGPVVLGRYFDTVGRKPMIAGTYIGSAVLTVVLALVFVAGIGNEWLFLGILVAVFFLASSGASAAYLTVSEIFPMETRALAIAFFYAIGTATGGIVGPILFGQLIGSGDRSLVAVAFYIGAAVMTLGGLAEIFFGVKAERATLEDLAQPLTVEDAETDDEDSGATTAKKDSDDDGSAGGDSADGDSRETVGASGSPGARPSGSAGARPSGQAAAPVPPPGRSGAGGSSSAGGSSRYRPGPGRAGGYSPWQSVSSRPDDREALEHEVESLINAVQDLGTVGERELYRRVGARYWGPGRFRGALRKALAEKRLRRMGGGKIGRPE